MIGDPSIGCRRTVGVLIMAAGMLLSATACGSPSNTSVDEWHVGSPVHVGGAPYGLVANADRLVVVNGDAKSVVVVDEAGSSALLAQGPDGPLHPPIAFGSLWTVIPSTEPATHANEATSPQERVARIDPTSGKVLALIPASARLLVSSPDAIWGIGAHGEDEVGVWRIDPTSNAATALPQRLRGLVGAATYGRDRLWVALNCSQQPCAPDEKRLITVDVVTGQVSRLNTRFPTDLVFGDMVLTPSGIALTAIHEVGNRMTGAVVMLDEQGQSPRTHELGALAGGVALSEDGIWVSNCDLGAITLLDEATGEPIGDPVVVGLADPLVEPVDLEREGSCPNAIAISGGTIWVANTNDDAVVPVRKNSA